MVNPALVWKVISVLYVTAKSPLVTKFLDNAVAGTTTAVDDWLWHGIKDLLGTHKPDEQKVNEVLEKVQGKYDADKEAAKAPAVIADFQNA